MSAPFTSESNRIVLTKIMLIYSIFYVIMKIVAIINGAWLWVNLVLCLPFVILALWGFLSIKKNTTTWLYVIVGILVISVIRYYEANLMIWLHEQIFN